MKLETHIIFSVGLVAFIVSRLGACPLCMVASIIAAVLTQLLIDYLGHGRCSRRYTHSPSGAIILGFVANIVALPACRPPVALATAIVSGLSHLLLDAFTKGGIYIMGRRVSLARIPYNHWAANAIFQMLGILLLLGTIVY